MRLMIFSLLIAGVIFFSCEEKKRILRPIVEKYYEEAERKAIDTLKHHGLLNYLDSAYLYTYVYFGEYKLKQCGTVDIDSVMYRGANRRIVYQDLILLRVRLIQDRSLVFLALTPLVKDSILSCDMIENAQLPNEIMFNYKEKRFKQFVYDEFSYLRVSGNPIHDYESRLKKVLDEDHLVPHKKFRDIVNNLINRKRI